ncbi:oxygenase MpaB family protein [Nocardia cyriacigeorgica]|uniref:oxygenase MpaB family protein n=1 Tax=Nocardia cyriacigeorgica TaxID=135487 RepID=UPI002455412B|nr:oxygenase MpaB family protein [Nocardia cyriacigeorgica]
MASTIPARHPDAPQTVPGLGLAPFARALGLRKPTPAQFDELGAALTIGDRPMDELVDWMYREGIAETRPLFERALGEGIDAVPEAPAPLRDFFEYVEAVPEWVDWDKIRRAELVFGLGGRDGLYVARDMSLLGGYLASGFNQTLLRTGALEKGPAKRFAETTQWAMDVTSTDGMRPLGLGYRSTVHVRMVHSMVRRHIAAQPDWRGEQWGLPINQTDMAATIIGALIAPMIGAIGMGGVVTPRDADAVAHFTRYVGWVMGVEERFLPKDFRDSVRILYHTMTAITNPDETSPQLALPMRDEPLSWHYDHLAGPRRRIARSQHLSIATMLLGPDAMKKLGLPAYTLPWYPMLRAPINFTRTVWARAVPGQFERSAARGRAAQIAFIRTLTGAETAVIGDSARGIHQAA